MVKDRTSARHGTIFEPEDVKLISAVFDDTWARLIPELVRQTEGVYEDLRGSNCQFALTRTGIDFAAGTMLPSA